MNKGQMNGLGCKNDETRSMKLCYATKGTRIRVYDDGNLSPSSDDWAEINVLQDMINNCETINTYEKTATYGLVDVVVIVVILLVVVVVEAVAVEVIMVVITVDDISFLICVKIEMVIKECMLTLNNSK